MLKNITLKNISFRNPRVTFWVSPNPEEPEVLPGESGGETLEAAVDNFGAAAEQAVEEMAARLEELRREQASSIVVPGQGGGQGGGSGLIGV